VAAALLQLPPVFVVAERPDALVTAQAGTGPDDTTGGMTVRMPPALPAAVSSSPTFRRAVLPRQSSRPSALPAAPIGVDISLPQAPAGQGAMIDRSEADEQQLLVAAPLPGAGASGVTSPGTVPGTLPLRDAAERGWWGGAAALVTSAGGGAATAGRATASFVTRLGSHVPELVKR
jgi:hypothetical protein